MSAAAQQPSASAAEDDSPSLLSLPDTLLFVLCGFLEDRACLALRATCSVLSAMLAPAVYVVVINLQNGIEQAQIELRWWRRYIRALMPRGTVPPICVVGSRAGILAVVVRRLLAKITAFRHLARAPLETVRLLPRDPGLIDLD